MDLQEKINLTKGIFERALSSSDPENIYVAWTGGKDSTVVLSLWTHFLEENGVDDKPKAINLDTGLKFPEIIRFRDEIALRWDIELNIVVPDLEISEYPVAKDKINCCRDLKVTPLKQAITELKVDTLLSGIRSDEHPSRSTRDQIEQKQSPDYVQINPILHWTEMDIWSFIVQKNLPYCTLYNHGYSSLGCMPCTCRSTGQERSGRAGDKEESLDLLRSMGYF
ncbi:phosphoadenosine phosphosulfate reductase family protein [Desulfonatronovibrio hydrogenovorans]|uniref:phosphoadenosine phosphosulfate reductase family protein n=1 Tax=Desulfonatronovibrio hydrogenovorans TaxID=53245 RepID=UPI00048A4F52|nr:phosphoadenosine phosphosulfate reductase family protein [Desulfonatronovibrio hydrogenovorans]